MHKGHSSGSNQPSLWLRDYPFILTLARLDLDHYGNFCEELWKKCYPYLEDAYQKIFTHEIYLVRNIEDIDFFQPLANSILLVGQGKERTAFFIPGNTAIKNHSDLEQCLHVSIKLPKKIRNKLSKLLSKAEPDNTENKHISKDELENKNKLILLNKQKLARTLSRTIILAIEKHQAKQRIAEPSADGQEKEEISHLYGNTILLLISSFLDEDKEKFKETIETLFSDFKEKIISKFELSHFSVTVANFLKQFEETLCDMLLSQLKNCFLQDVPQLPSAQEIFKKDPKTNEVVCMRSANDIAVRSTFIADENAFTFSMQKTLDPIQYFGFDKIHSCIGVVIRHPATGKMLIVHVSSEVDKPACVATVLNHFETELASDDRLLEIRLVGGVTQENEEIHNSPSGEVLSSFFCSLLISAYEKKLQLIILSADIFSKIDAYRAYHEKHSVGNDVTIGWLINRDGQIILFKYPKLGYLPFTDKSCSIFLDDLKNPVIWRLIRKACKTDPMHEGVSLGQQASFLEKLKASAIDRSEIIKIYDDVTPDWNRNFALKLNEKFKEILIAKIAEHLPFHDLAYSANDTFTITLIMKNIETWTNAWYQGLKGTLDEGTTALLQICPFFYHFRHFTLYELYTNTDYGEIFPMPLSAMEIKYLFFNRLFDDNYLKNEIYNTMFLRCAALLHYLEHEKKEKESKAWSQESEIEKGTEEEREKESEKPHVPKDSQQEKGKEKEGKKSKEKETENSKEKEVRGTREHFGNLGDLADHPIIALLERLNVSRWYLFDEINTYLAKTQNPSPEMVPLLASNNLIMALLEQPENAEYIITAWQKEILEVEVDRLIAEYLPDIDEQLLKSIKESFMACDVSLLHFSHTHSAVQLTLANLMESLKSLIFSHEKWSELSDNATYSDIGAKIRAKISDWISTAALLPQNDPFTNLEQEEIIADDEEAADKKNGCCTLY